MGGGGGKTSTTNIDRTTDQTTTGKTFLDTMNMLDTTSTDRMFQETQFQDLLDSAAGLKGKVGTYGPGTYAGVDPAMRDYMGAATGRAGGDPTMGMARAGTEDIMGGSLREGNVYRDKMMDQISGKIREQYGEAVGKDSGYFAAMGRGGSGAHAAQARKTDEALGKSLGEAATNIYYGDYQDTLNREAQARRDAGMFGEESRRDVGMLRDVGVISQADREAAQRQEQDKFRFGQGEEANRLRTFKDLISGGMGGTRTGTSIGTGTQAGTQDQTSTSRTIGTDTQRESGGSSGFGQLLGTGLTIAGMATGNPWLGTAATGLSGLFGGGDETLPDWGDYSGPGSVGYQQ